MNKNNAIAEKDWWTCGALGALAAYCIVPAITSITSYPVPFLISGTILAVLIMLCLNYIYLGLILWTILSLSHPPETGNSNAAFMLEMVATTFLWTVFIILWIRIIKRSKARRSTQNTNL
ncbi:MAG: hypothetical protein ABJA67_00550 [Chthonomonadales bacterium]